MFKLHSSKYICAATIKDKPRAKSKIPISLKQTLTFMRLQSNTSTIVRLALNKALKM